LAPVQADVSTAFDVSLPLATSVSGRNETFFRRHAQVLKQEGSLAGGPEKFVINGQQFKGKECSYFLKYSATTCSENNYPLHEIQRVMILTWIDFLLLLLLLRIKLCGLFPFRIPKLWIL
jgi:hypothetical protein